MPREEYGTKLILTILVDIEIIAVYSIQMTVLFLLHMTII